MDLTLVHILWTRTHKSSHYPVVDHWRQQAKVISRASLVVQWLRIRLPMQGTWVQVLVWEDLTCRGATKPVRHNY